MHPNLYFTKVNYLALCNYANKQPIMAINSKKIPLELQSLLKLNPNRLDLVRLELEVLYMEELGNVDKLLKEIIFLFTYSSFNKHYWIIDEQGTSIDTMQDFFIFLEDLLFDFLLDLKFHRKLKKYQKVIQSYFPNIYYNFYLKGIMALRENELKLAYVYFKKANKQRPFQENTLIQIQHVCKKLNKTKELKKYTKQHENMLL